MKIVIYSLFAGFVLSLVRASECDSSESKSSQESQENLEFDADHVKENFIEVVMNGNVFQAKLYVNRYKFLIEKFDRDIFQGLIDCFDTIKNGKQRLNILKLIRPSFEDVSQSTVTPLILAIRQDKQYLVNALLNIREVKLTIGVKDEYDRTALMNAAQKGNLNAAQRILLEAINTKEYINAKDCFGKTAVHYACEMKPNNDYFGDLQYNMVTLLMTHHAEVYAEGPEYNLKFVNDPRVKSMLKKNNCEVVVGKRFNDAQMGKLKID